MPRETGAVILAGMDTITNPQRLYKGLVRKYHKEKEWYLWDRYKPLLQLEDLSHRRFCTIDRVVKAAIDSELVKDFVVVGRPDMGDYLEQQFPGVHFVEQGAGFGESLERGYISLREAAKWLSDKEKVLMITADLPRITGSLVDNVVAMAQKVMMPAQHLLLTCVDAETVGNFKRSYAPCWDNLLSNPPQTRRMKESNYLFLNAGSDFDTLGDLYNIRKFRHPENWGRALWLLTTKGVASTLLPIALRAIALRGRFDMAQLNRGLARLVGEPTTGLLFESPLREFNLDIDSEEDIARLGYSLLDYTEYKALLTPKAGLERQFEEWWGEEGLVVKTLRPNNPGMRGAWVMSVEASVLGLDNARFFVQRINGQERNRAAEGLLQEAKQYANYTRLGVYGKV